MTTGAGLSWRHPIETTAFTGWLDWWLTDLSDSVRGKPPERVPNSSLKSTEGYGGNREAEESPEETVPVYR